MKQKQKKRIFIHTLSFGISRILASRFSKKGTFYGFMWCCWAFVKGKPNVLGSPCIRKACSKRCSCNLNASLSSGETCDWWWYGWCCPLTSVFWLPIMLCVEIPCIDCKLLLVLSPETVDVDAATACDTASLKAASAWDRRIASCMRSVVGEVDDCCCWCSSDWWLFCWWFRDASTMDDIEARTAAFIAICIAAIPSVGLDIPPNELKMKKA